MQADSGGLMEACMMASGMRTRHTEKVHHFSPALTSLSLATVDVHVAEQQHEVCFMQFYSQHE